ncbi:MAG: hypothetical protein ACYC3I_00015 [Gemmataceae bacterium]
MKAPRNGRRVDPLIRQRLPGKDRRLITMYLQEGGNYSAIARRLGRDSGGIRDRYHLNGFPLIPN